MSRLKLAVVVACFCLTASESAYAQAGWRHHPRYYYGYGPPVYAYPPVVVPPPPVVVGPTYGYPAPAYIAPPPPVPVYPPPAYGYGVIGPRGHVGFGYATPGFGVYLGR